jgi:hypothetical protein
MTKSPYLLPTALLVLCLGAVPAAGMLSNDSSEPALSDGPLPRQASPPQPLVSGEMNNGQPFLVKGFPADGPDGIGEVRCFVITYGEPRGAAPASSLASLADAKFCLNPGAPPLSAMMSELFVDPETGEVSRTPQRFVYGVIRGNAERVTIHGPDGRTTEFDTVDVPDTELEAFAGSLPRSADKGPGLAVAENAAGERIGRQDLTFGQFAEKPENEMPPESADYFDR